MSSNAGVADAGPGVGRRVPYVFSMKHNSLEDGPGIRSVIFVKGCNLDCAWCHNPESKRQRNELSFDRSACIGCRECLPACPAGALQAGDPSAGEAAVVIDRQACDTCLQCVDVCPTRALSAVGRSAGVDELVEEVLRYRTFIEASGGGVTLSGGEPTLFTDFTSSLLARFKAEGLHTLIETNGRFRFEDFAAAILPHTDMIYFDIKIVDRDEHRRFCGTANDTILENFLRLHRMSQSGGFTVVPRTPLIPDVTDTERNITDLARFYAEHGVTRTMVLKSNPLWAEKYTKLGIGGGLIDLQAPRGLYPKKRIEELSRIYRDFGVEVTTG
ncbi:MAG: glycyl-radical enzyme activating protein [Actinomycetota bacterium]|nr:glycyl-radical enzyme activating protein [Actinomycetota bacterium]